MFIGALGALGSCAGERRKKLVSFRWLGVGNWYGIGSIIDVCDGTSRNVWKHVCWLWLGGGICLHPYTRAT